MVLKDGGVVRCKQICQPWRRIINKSCYLKIIAKIVFGLRFLVAVVVYRFMNRGDFGSIPTEGITCFENRS